MSDAHEKTRSAQQGAASPERTLSETDVQRFFARKWHLDRCEVCGNERFEVNGQAPVTTMKVSSGMIPPQLFSLAPQRSYLQISCSSCGNTKFFDAAIVRRGLEAED